MSNDTTDWMVCQEKVLGNIRRKLLFNGRRKQ